MSKKMKKKIIITGDSGRGKTTLANKLAVKTGIKHYSTDDFFWKIKYSEPNDREEALEKINKIYDTDSWIVEGTTGWLVEDGFEKADLILFLHFNSLLAQWWNIIVRDRREKRGNIKELLYLMRHVLYRRYGWGYKKGKVKIDELVEPYKDKTIFVSSFKKVDKVLEDFNI